MGDVRMIAYGTDALGDPLASAPFLVYQPLVTNSQIRSNDLADVEWTASNMTVGDQDETGITGAPNTACSLTATAGNATLIANAVTDAADNQATKWWIKRDTGTGTVELTLDNGSTWQDVTADIDTTFGTGVVVDQAALANPQIGIRLGTSGDVVIIGNSQLHLGATTEQVLYAGPIFTTTATASTDSVNIEFDASNTDNASSLYYAELVLPFSGGFANPTTTYTRHFQLDAGLGGRWGFEAASGLIYADDGPNLVKDTAAPTAGDTTKVALLYADSNMSIFRDGVKQDESSFDGSFGDGSVFVIGEVVDHTFLIRNIQRREIPNYAAGEARALELTT